MMKSALEEEIGRAVRAALEDERDNLRAVMREELARASTAGDPDQLLSAEQVAKAVGKTPAAVRRAHERGTLGIEAIKVGRRSLRWRAGDVRALARAAGGRRG